MDAQPYTAENATTPKKKQVQPRHHAGKSRAAAAARRRKIVKDIIAGKPLKQAGIDAGLSPKTAASQVSQILAEPKVKDDLIAAMGEIGITDDCIAERLRALLYGTKVIAANIFAPGSGTDLADAGSMTKDFVEVPDNVALAKGIEIACKIKGQFTKKHEVDLKRPVTVIIRKFCSPVDPSAGVNQPAGGTPA